MCCRYETAKKKGDYDEEQQKRENAKHALERYMHYYQRWAENDKARLQVALAPVVAEPNQSCEMTQLAVHEDILCAYVVVAKHVDMLCKHCETCVFAHVANFLYIYTHVGNTEVIMLTSSCPQPLSIS